LDSSTLREYQRPIKALWVDICVYVSRALSAGRGLALLAQPGADPLDGLVRLREQPGERVPDVRLREPGRLSRDAVRVHRLDLGARGRRRPGGSHQRAALLERQSAQVGLLTGSSTVASSSLAILASSGRCPAGIITARPPADNRISARQLPADKDYIHSRSWLSRRWGSGSGPAGRTVSSVTPASRYAASRSRT